MVFRQKQLVWGGHTCRTVKIIETLLTRRIMFAFKTGYIIATAMRGWSLETKIMHQLFL